MSANLYAIQDLLVGKFYRSNSTSGVIEYAEKDERSVWYNNAESYLVRLENGKWRTVAVKVGA